MRVRVIIMVLLLAAGGCVSQRQAPADSANAGLADAARADARAGVRLDARADAVLAGLRAFYQATARADGSFSPGVDPAYLGMADTAYSDLAAVTYAVTIHKTFGWKLPHEAKTIEFILSRQRPTGEFFNVAGTISPDSPEGKTYNTTQALVALKALGVKPRHDPMPVFESVLQQDYKTLPPYSTSFFPLAYLCYGQAIPEKADRGIRALMVQDETGYMNNHVAATYHASHYYRLVGEATPKADEMVARTLRDQNADGSWLINAPARDRHGTFDAVFILHQEGRGRSDCRAAIQRAARWALACRNADGGFGHYPGSTSDADAIYFHVGTLVMAGVLKPADPLPPDPHLLSWGHLMPVRDERSQPFAPSNRSHRELWSVKADGWIGALAFAPDSKTLVAGIADHTARVFAADTGKETLKLAGHGNHIVAVSYDRAGAAIATGSYDHTARLWDARTGAMRHELKGHQGAVLAVAFSPDQKMLATASIDRTIRLWDVRTGTLKSTLAGHGSWVNALAFARDGALVSGSSDGTVKIWSLETGACQRTLRATNAEVRSIACSADGRWVAAGMRYGQLKVWDTATWQERHAFKAHDADIWCLAFTPNSNALLTGNGDWNRGGQIKRWDIETGQQDAELHHTGEVLTLAISPDGSLIAGGGGDKRIRVWLQR